MNFDNSTLGQQVFDDHQPRAISPLNITRNLKMIDNLPPKSKHIKVTFRVHDKTYDVSGRTAQTLCWLVYFGASGITAAEVSSWAYRLADYVHALRHRYGIMIRTDEELHDGGWHARYVLEDYVEIIRIEFTK